MSRVQNSKIRYPQDPRRLLHDDNGGMRGTAPSTVTLTRLELYERVWSTPMRQLAKEFGLSDVGLAKICRKHDIPRPPVGYWARVAHGQQPEQTPLPPAPTKRAAPISIQRRDTLEVDPDEAIEMTEGNVPEIVVPDRLVSPHPLVLATRRHLKDAPVSRGFLDSGSTEGTLDVRVSKKQLPRALRIMNTILKQLESEGGSARIRVASDRYHRSTTYLCKDDEHVSVWIEERITHSRDGNSPNSYIVDSQPTGELSLHIEGVYGGGLRRNWSDRKTRRLEESLGSFFRGLHSHFRILRVRRLDAQIARRQADRVKARKEEEAQFEKREKAGREELHKLVDRWHQAERIRAYLNALRRKVDESAVSPEDPAWLAKSIAWASRYADTLDPLAAPGENPFDEGPVEPTNVPIEQVEFTSRVAPIVKALGVTDVASLATVSKEQVQALSGDDLYGVWNETRLVLQGHGYNAVSK